MKREKRVGQHEWDLEERSRAARDGAEAGWRQTLLLTKSRSLWTTCGACGRPRSLSRPQKVAVGDEAILENKNKASLEKIRAAARAPEKLFTIRRIAKRVIVSAIYCIVSTYPFQTC